MFKKEEIAGDNITKIINYVLKILSFKFNISHLLTHFFARLYEIEHTFILVSKFMDLKHTRPG